MVTATSGQVQSAPIYLDIERDDLPVRVESEQSPFYCWLMHGPRPLLLYATYADGTQVSISQSTRITFTSEDPNIASVSKDGTVVGVHAGSTRILINGKYPINVIVRHTPP